MPHLTFLNSASIHKGLQQLIWNAASKAPAPLVAPVVELIINRTLRKPLAGGELEFLTGRQLTLEITDLKRSLNIGLVQGKLTCDFDSTRGDVTFKGNVEGFVALALKTQDPDTLFFNRSLSIRGDTELGLEIKNLIDRLDLTDNLDRPLLQTLHLINRVTQRSTEHFTARQ